MALGWFLGDYRVAAAGNDLIVFFSVSTGLDDSADVMAVRATRIP